MITIEQSGGKLRVKSPKHLDWITAAKGLGGSWYQGAWEFAADKEAMIRRQLIAVYGTDGTDGTDTSGFCTLRIEWKDGGKTRLGPIAADGRVIAAASGRNSGAWLGDDIVILSGGFGSGGSVKNWETIANKGTTVLVYHFPRAVAEQLIAETAVARSQRTAIDNGIADDKANGRLFGTTPQTIDKHWVNIHMPSRHYSVEPETPTAQQEWCERAKKHLQALLAAVQDCPDSKRRKLYSEQIRILDDQLGKECK